MSEALRKFGALVKQINHNFVELAKCTNDELRSEFKLIEENINRADAPNNTLDENLVKVFAIVKETSRRFADGDLLVTANENDIRLAERFDFVTINGDKACYKHQWLVRGIPFCWEMVHYDEQLLGGILLHYGYAIEMATGEGKTLVATLPVMLNALTHQGVHLMTVNDYLSKRDYEMTRPIYMFHGLTADCIEFYSRDNDQKKMAYQADVTFGTNSNFTFDYLFDHLAMSSNECVQQKHTFAIIDELDSILIDEATTPHIVSGGNYYNEEKIYKDNLPLIKDLIDTDRNHDLFESTSNMACFTKEGKKWLAEKKDLPDLFSVNKIYEVKDFDNLGIEQQEHIREMLYVQNVLFQLLKALTVYVRDVDYLVESDKVKIIDQNTGRVKEHSRWSFGLHTAIEVKEGVKVQKNSDGMGIISLKNYFRLYDKIAGMSGTIMTAKNELQQIYKLKCAALPTHCPIIRIDEPLRVYRTKEKKDAAIIDLIVNNHDVGRPTLVCNVNLKRSDHFARLLEDRGIAFNRLDARTTKGEALLVAKAGIGNTITLATSVAGRGTDIKPSEDALSNGGLMVIGTDLFDSVRIDNQLKGRSGRQGNPGTSVFFASLEDSILDWLSKSEKKQLGLVTKSLRSTQKISALALPFFEKAQAIRESLSRKDRKNVAKKDDIIAPHRLKFYEKRNSLLFDSNVIEDLISDIISSTGYSFGAIDKHLVNLYSCTLVLIDRILRNNPNTSQVSVPFSANRRPFIVKLDVSLVRQSIGYFINEFKRQMILQIYDENWKSFVAYMMGDLDKHEINQLDVEYGKMMKDVIFQVISRLTNSTIIFEVNGENPVDSFTPTESRHKQETSNMLILPESPCPCGSGKKYCDCHGSSNRGNLRVRRRR